MTGLSDVTGWLRSCDEPWTRYRTLIDLEGRDPTDPGVAEARADMAGHEAVRRLLARALEWPGYPLRRHNDAAHPLYAIATLADFGMTRADPGIADLADAVLAHFDGAGFETLLWLPRFLTKEDDDEDRWAWMLCDAPTLLYALLAFGYGTDDRVAAAVSALVARSEPNGWRCGAADSLPRFAGPGRKDDTCPMATTYALKALAEVPGSGDTPTVSRGCDALLGHWEHQEEYKLKMFGIGTDFRKLKYPYVWYDILHVTDVLSRHAATRGDPRLREMVDEIAHKADADGRYVAESMYRAWTGWSFADKKAPSPWLTLLAVRTQRRVGG